MTTTADTAVGPARANYDQLFTRWKALLKDLFNLQQRFNVAEQHELAEIRDAYLRKVADGYSLIDQLRVAALEAYKEAPGADPELTQLLVKIATDDVARDRYEQAWEVCEELIKANPVPDKSLYDLAGTTAFSLHRFDLAKEYLSQAESLGALQQGQDLLPYVDEVRETWQKEQPIRAAEAAADDLPRVRLETVHGDIVLELFENEAPDTVGNFVSLVEKGFYDGLEFHRVIPGFVAQAGCPEGTGRGGPGYKIYCECYRDDHRNHFRGSLSMAKSAPRDSGGSQFFLTFRPTPHLNGKHTVFGRVLEGLDVLAKIQRRDPDNADQASVVPDRIVKASVIRKRDHAYEPHKVQ